MTAGQRSQKLRQRGKERLVIRRKAGQASKTSTPLPRTELKERLRPFQLVHDAHRVVTIIFYIFSLNGKRQAV